MLRGLICVVLLAFSSAAWSVDPILVLLLRMVRDQAISASVQAGVEALLENPPQRAAVFSGMEKILSDPQNAARKAQIVAEFSLQARMGRDSYRKLDSLSYFEKRTLAAQAREEFRRLPAAERQQMLEVLQTRMLPLPRDLNDIMLVEFSSAAPAVAGNALRVE